MKTLYAPKSIDCSHLLKKPATDDHYSIIIDEPTTVVSHDGAEVIAVFDNVQRETDSLLGAVSSMKYIVDWRTDGMQSRSRTFGAQPRIPLRRNFCSVASSAREHQAQHRELERWAQYAADFLTQHVPDVAAEQLAKVRTDIKPNWRMACDMFTSGIVNQTVPLWYHRDAGNLKDAWSTMVVLSDAVPGGLTVMPEYGIAFRYDGAQVITFNGSKHLHGVTPPRASSRGYRYSTVWYALAGLCLCGTPAEELDRVRKAKTESERMRHSRNRGALEDNIKKGKAPELRAPVVQADGDVDIYIPSKGRADKLKVMESLSDATLSTRVAVVVYPEERAAYEATGLKVLCVPEGVRGVGQKRQWICDQHQGDKLYMLDDDLTFRMRAEGKLVQATPADVDDMLGALERELNASAVVGVSAQAGNNRLEPGWSLSTRQYAVHGLDMRRVREHGWRWDRMELMEDFDFLLQALRSGCPNAVTSMWAHAAKANAPGGCSTYRTAERQRAAAEALAAAHPGFVTVVEKPGWEGMGETRADVRVAWKKAVDQGARNALERHL